MLAARGGSDAEAAQERQVVYGRAGLKWSLGQGRSSRKCPLLLVCSTGDEHWSANCTSPCMSKAIPTIQKYMTTSPHSIGVDQTVEMAAKAMTQHNIRHLPVLRGGKLVGILTDRDVKLVVSLTGVDATTLPVEEAMTADPYTTTPDTPLNEVVNEMAEMRYGSAVITQNHHVVGIFTTVDCCQALSELLTTRLK